VFDFYFTQKTAAMRKILIVDDEPNIVMSLEYTFKKNNFEVFIARDGQEALDILKTQFPDIIILDIMMPLVDGFETLEQIKKNEQLNHCKVIFLSAKNKESDIEKGMALGADAYLTKPFSIKKVVEQVNELLES
jgi:DNA-binding response OmpR family regulator